MKTKHPKLSYTVPEACEATGLSRFTLWRQVKAGKLDCSKIGGRVLILSASLEALLQQGRKAFIK